MCGLTMAYLSGKAMSAKLKKFKAGWDKGWWPSLCLSIMQQTNCYEQLSCAGNRCSCCGMSGRTIQCVS